MPYIILILGIITALYALYRFLIKANPRQVKSLFKIVFASIFILVLFFFAATGRIIISIGLVVLSIPFLISFLKAIGKSKDGENDEKDKS